MMITMQSTNIYRDMSEKVREQMQIIYRASVLVLLGFVSFFLTQTYTKIQDNQSEIIGLLKRLERNDQILAQIDSRVDKIESRLNALEKNNIEQKKEIIAFFREFSPALEWAKRQNQK